MKIGIILCLFFSFSAMADMCRLAKEDEYAWCVSLEKEDCSLVEGYDNLRCRAYLEKRCDLLPFERDQRLCNEVFNRTCSWRQPTADDGKIISASPMKGALSQDYWFCRAVTENCSLLN